MITGKYTYKADIDGNLTIEQQIERANIDAIRGHYTNEEFSDSLRYDVTRTVTNIFSNSVITYNGVVDEYCNSLQKMLIDIYFELYKSGKCYLKFDEQNKIVGVSSTKGSVEIVDKAYMISKITQRHAADKQLKMYGLITNVSYSILDERGMFGVFSPERGEVIKESQKDKMYDAFRSVFGGKKLQKKFAITEVPMKYSGVSIPVAELQLLENEKKAIANVARIFGIQSDMILTGSTFDNKENAIIQTYTDFKGLIYDWITQIEAERLLSFKVIDNFDIKFPGVPQMNKSDVKVNEIPMELLGTLSVNEKRSLIDFESIDTKANEISLLSEKLGVGGTQALVNILVDPNLTDDQKRGTLKVLFSLSDIDVLKLIPIKI